jgi:hypothetical protein
VSVASDSLTLSQQAVTDEEEKRAQFGPSKLGRESISFPDACGEEVESGPAFDRELWMIGVCSWVLRIVGRDSVVPGREVTSRVSTAHPSNVQGRCSRLSRSIVVGREFACRISSIIASGAVSG